MSHLHQVKLDILQNPHANNFEVKIQKDANGAIVKENVGKVLSAYYISDRHHFNFDSYIEARLSIASIVSGILSVKTFPHVLDMLSLLCGAMLGQLPGGFRRKLRVYCAAVEEIISCISVYAPWFGDFFVSGCSFSGMFAPPISSPVPLLMIVL